MRILIIVTFFSCLLIACKNKSADKKSVSEEKIHPPDSTRIVKAEKDSILLKLTNEVLTAFKNKDYKALARYIHPEGVRFSPYSFIDSVNNKVISAELIESWADKKNRSVILWGNIDATDEPIKGTIDDYIKQFVYDVDFLHPEKIKVNEFAGQGNTINNLRTFYPGCDFTESHFSGFEKKYEGMDWRSIRLVYKINDGKYLLVGVIHDQWTT